MKKNAGDMKVTDAFVQTIKDLNEEQRHAVELIEGPVMVIAGPGTGKTRILSTRVGNIILRTDTLPENVLCLTYTKTAAANMRAKLVELIGPEGYKVNVATYHSFCSMVISEYPEAFSNNLDLNLITELEKNEILQDLIFNLPSSDALFQPGEVNAYLLKEISRLFEIIQMEHWDISEAEQRYQLEIDKAHKIALIPSEKVKQQKRIKKIKQSLSAIALFVKYKNTTSAKGLYDYVEMLIWVIDKFKEDEDILADYQERFQYILVDEAQDSNGAQNEIVNLLTKYWPRPNLFIVGDDDQSIYKFQGASPNKMLDFVKQYDPEIIVLTKNYRSSRKITETANTLIENNKTRLTNFIEGVDKKVVAAREDIKDIPVPVTIFSFDNPLQESQKIFRKLKSIHKKGHDLSSMAIIYRNHKDAENLKTALLKEGVPIQESRSMDALSTVFFKKVERILEYVNLESRKSYSGDHLLFEILHYDFFSIQAKDIAFISGLYSSKTDELSWRGIISSPPILKEASLASRDKITKVSEALEGLILAIHSKTFQCFFEELLSNLGVLEYILKENNSNLLLDILKSVFDLIKAESEKNPYWTNQDFLHLVSRMRKYKLSIPVNYSYGSELGAHFLTAHGSKGLEFDTVFILAAVESKWKPKTRPPSFILILKPQLEEETFDEWEELRRLFYVAMTRCKKNLFVSTSKKNNRKGKESELRFVTEIKKSSHIIVKDITSVPTTPFFTSLFKKEKVLKTDIDPFLVQKFMLNYSVSITGLNKYLKCNIAFYFEDILRIPSARVVHIGFGNAVHEAMRGFIVAYGESNLVDFSLLNEFFEEGLVKFQSHFTAEEFKKYSQWGKTEFRTYYESRKSSYAKPKKFETEYKISNTHIEGIPVNGNLDRIDVYDSHVVVFDYKTGNPDRSTMESMLKSPKKRDSLGGDYWRQMVYYKMLLAADTKNNYRMERGYFDFIRLSRINDEFITKELVITQADMDFVTAQLMESYRRLSNGIFDHSCGKDTCKWCTFTEQYL